MKAVKSTHYDPETRKDAPRRIKKHCETERKSKMELLDKIREYSELLDIKERLEAQTKANNAAIEAIKAEIAQQMIDDDCPSISSSGFTYSLQMKTSYNKKSDADLQAAGVDFLQTLRDEGMGDIIKERVDPRTLSAAVKAQVEANDGELSEGLAAIVTPYDYNDISRRKISKKGAAAK